MKNLLTVFATERQPCVLVHVRDVSDHVPAAIERLKAYGTVLPVIV